MFMTSGQKRLIRPILRVLECTGEQQNNIAVNQQIATNNQQRTALYRPQVQLQFPRLGSAKTPQRCASPAFSTFLQKNRDFTRHCFTSDSAGRLRFNIDKHIADVCAVHEACK